MNFLLFNKIKLRKLYLPYKGDCIQFLPYYKNNNFKNIKYFKILAYGKMTFYKTAPNDTDW